MLHHHGPKLISALVLLGWLFPQVALSQVPGTSSVTGVVRDAIERSTLPSAHVTLRHGDTFSTVIQTITETDGRYDLTDLSAGEYVITVSFTGFETEEFAFTLSEGVVRTLNFDLQPEVLEMETLVVTGGRIPEKMLDSPTSMSVVQSEDLQRDVTTSPIETLRKVPGIDMARTGIDRREVVVRGFGKTFTGATYVMTDYRQSAIASLGVNAYNMMPISSMDLDRVEVVRGPAGAVYGPGVDEGAIHFISKDPFTSPGTTVSISGGQQAMMQGELRHAGVLNNRIGYKIVAQYLQADDWKLDPSDPHDADLITRYYSQIPLDADVTKLVLNGTVAYQFNPRTILTAVGGFASAKSSFLSDIGPLQSDGFGYRFGQLRLQSGRFFAQAYLNANDAGNSFIYAGPQVAESLSGEAVVDNSTQFNAQAQYALDFANGAQFITFGTDFEHTNPATDGTINGRNEDDDRIIEMGVYAQSRTRLTDKLSFTAAVRGDYDNIFEKLQVSPRAAIVYKPLEQHSLRASFNRAFASPGTNSLFLDIVARSGDPDILPFDVRARGAGHGFRFEHDPAYLSFASTDLVATSFLPIEGVFGRPQPVGMDLDLTYDLIYQRIGSIPVPDLTQILCGEGLCLPEEQVAFLQAELAPGQTHVSGFSDGSLGLLDLSTGNVSPVASAPDIAPLKQSTTQTFEIGYRGHFGGRVGLSVEGYYTVKENFVRGLKLETPFVFAPLLSDDLLPAIRDGVAGNEDLAAALEQLNIPPEMVAALIVELAAPDLPSPTTPIAIAQPMENNPGLDQRPELLMTYRNFGRVEFFGLEASMDVILNHETMLFGSVSWVSDGFFDHEELGEENEDLYVSLNAPKFKAGAGVSYAAERSFSVSAAARYVEGFTVHSGPYNGFVDDYLLVDLGAGYDFSRYAPGLRVDVTVQNVLDHMHREFVGAPKMGRLGLARLTYTF